MSFVSFNTQKNHKVELRPKKCIDSVLKPLTDNIDIKINGSLTCKDLFCAAICMAVENSSIHSMSKHYLDIPCETSTRDVTLRYFFALISFLFRNTWLYIQKKHFTILKQCPQIIDEDKFRFDRFILFVGEWLRRKLRI